MENVPPLLRVAMFVVAGVVLVSAFAHLEIIWLYLAIGIVVAGVLARKKHIERLRRGLRPIPTDRAVQAEVAAVVNEASHSQWISPESSTVAVLAAGEYLWSWTTIDPDVVHAAAFSSVRPVTNALSFIRLLDHQYEHLDAVGRAGAANRLLGYIGEQKANALLTAQGHLVQVAAKANQPVWDFLVDGHAVNIKTVGSVSEIRSAAMQHPDTTYLVPTDASGHVGHNIVRLPGFSHANTSAVLHHATAAGTGDAPWHSFVHAVPWVTVGFAAYRNYRLYEAGLAANLAVESAVLDAVFRGTGIVVGGKLGGIAGTAVAGFGPGTAVGAVLGAFAGSSVGARIAHHVKTRHVRSAVEELERLLAQTGVATREFAYGLTSSLNAELARSGHAVATLERVRAERPGWRTLWPSEFDVMVRDGLAVGRQAHLRRWSESWPVLNLLSQVPTTGDQKVLARYGLLLSNLSALDTVSYVSAERLAAIDAARGTVQLERKKIDPLVTKPARRRH